MERASGDVASHVCPGVRRALSREEGTDRVGLAGTLSELNSTGTGENRSHVRA